MGLSVCVCVCLSVKSHLTYGASVRPENAVTYSEGNEGQKICGVFSEDAPLLRSSCVAVVFHTFRWPFFFIAKAVRMRIGIHSYGCRTAGEYPAYPTIVSSFSLAQCRYMERELTAPRVTAKTRGVANFRACVSQDSTRRGFCTLVLFMLYCVGDLNPLPIELPW